MTYHLKSRSIFALPAVTSWGSRAWWWAGLALSLLIPNGQARLVKGPTSAWTKPLPQDLALSPETALFNKTAGQDASGQKTASQRIDPQDPEYGQNGDVEMEDFSDTTAPSWKKPGSWSLGGNSLDAGSFGENPLIHHSLRRRQDKGQPDTRRRSQIQNPELSASDYGNRPINRLGLSRRLAIPRPQDVQGLAADIRQALPPDLQQHIPKKTCQDILYAIPEASADGRRSLIREKAYISCLSQRVCALSQDSQNPIPQPLVQEANRQVRERVRTVELVEFAETHSGMHQVLQNMQEEAKDDAMFRMDGP